MKKIMFNDTYGLTKAVLEGRKTMTRRLVPHGTPLGNWEDTEKKSRYKVGEVVAVAQNYGAILDELEDPRNFSCMEHWESKSGDRGKYAELAMYSPGGGNKMFVRADLMPHQIRFTDVWVERLQDISEVDCLREGIYEVPFCEFAWDDNGKTFKTAREAFATLIDKVSGKGTWKSNPWVYAYEFELVK